MRSLKNFIKRNTPVFVLGLVITLVFLVIILAQPKSENNVPAGFKKVEEKVFESGKPTEPPKNEEITQYASQIPSPENKGKPYFYGESNPNLRDSEGYPTPPSPDTVEIPSTFTDEDKMALKQIVQETYAKRTAVVTINYTDAGFDPTDVITYTGQRINWINTTDKQITINQTLSIHEALTKGLVLKPGESVIFRPLVNGTFTYLENGSKKYGSITVIDVTAPLQ